MDHSAVTSLPSEEPAAAQQSRLGELLQAYLNDARLFVTALEELQGQLGAVQSHRSNLEPQQSATLKRVLEKAPSAAFQEYLAGSPASRGPPQPNLAQQIDDNFCLLGVLSLEMHDQVASIEKLQAVLQERMQEAIRAAAEDAGGCQAEPASLRSLPQVDANIVAAALVDGLRQDVALTGKVGAAVSLATPSEQVASYTTLLRIQPHLQEVLVAEALSWRRTATVSGGEQ